MSEKWIITVGAGYGSFEFEGTEAEAEEMRRHKANWEGGPAVKRRATEPPSVRELAILKADEEDFDDDEE